MGGVIEEQEAKEAEEEKDAEETKVAFRLRAPLEPLRPLKLLKPLQPLIMTFLLFLILLYWLVKAVDFISGVLFRMKLLAPSDSRGGFQTRPYAQKISIIFAARNEGERIREAVCSLLAQDYPDFEVIAASDRSTDDTLSILEAIRREFPRLSILNIEKLPDGWLGKTHALQKGYEISSGQWILFTDADVHMHPATLKASMKAVEEFGVDHLTLIPDLISKSFIEEAFVHFFSVLLFSRFRIWAASSPKSRAYAGTGAFNFVKRSAYEKAGTHKRLALEVIDDMKFGKMIKDAGFRQMAMIGKKLIRVRWVEGWKGVLSALHKNAFPGLDYNLGMLLLATAGLLLTDVLPYAALWFLSGQALMISAGTLLLIAATYFTVNKYSKNAGPTFFYHPFLALLMLFILWRSSLAAVKQGGIYWRDTFYPLKELKRFKV